MAALEVRTSTSGKMLMEIDLAQEKGTFFSLTFKAVWNAMRFPCGVENSYPCKSSR